MNGIILTPNFRYKGSSPPFFPVRKLDKWVFYRYKNFGRTFFSFITIHAFDKRTDGQIFRS